ncbi:MAG: 50S ribosomal protein L24 [Bdellovibrionaceae bacterium]|nr:50S ribosomal protein L24 [Pseudobdellovibrionaceae bacterium]MBX3034442.1 50S ribosomal protein L24 [Pseudobdellovibrionaceae bacterium]
MKLKIKKGATVQVITGSDKGKKGEVLAIDHLNLRIKVQGVKVQTHFDKKEGQLKKEGFIDYSNVKLVSAAAEKAKKTSKKAAKSKSAE